MFASSASNHGRQAKTSPSLGFLWMRRLPRSSNLKCLTALVRVDIGPVDAGFRQRSIQKPAGGPDERQTSQIFFIAGMLTDHYDPRPGPSVAEHRLGRVTVEIAAAAVPDFVS
jgi:hypothetical protein